jgi:hypothetical protein
MANKAFVPTNMKLTHQQETRKSNVAETLYPSRITLHLPYLKKKKKKKKKNSQFTPNLHPYPFFELLKETCV